MNYKILTEAISYYESQGFKYIDVPWIVSNKIQLITAPSIKNIVKVKQGGLVGSAEQSFLSLISSDQLPKGLYCSCTPCFRNDIFDELHKLYFMKVELINTKHTTKKAFQDMFNIAFNFFAKSMPVKRIETLEGWDIVDVKNGIELGSYGIRSYPKIGKWIYGTGVAEPRYTQVLNKQ